MLGSPHCGKGEPSQVIRVGHASPACVFSDVAVFGGEEDLMNAPRDVAHASGARWKRISTISPRSLDRALAAGEAYTAWFSAEASDFVRMNRGKVRQPGAVVQRYLDVDLIRGARHASHRLSLAGDIAGDRERAARGRRGAARRSSRTSTTTRTC